MALGSKNTHKVCFPGFQGSTTISGATANGILAPLPMFSMRIHVNNLGKAKENQWSLLDFTEQLKEQWMFQIFIPCSTPTATIFSTRLSKIPKVEVVV